MTDEIDHSHPKAGRVVGPLVCVPCQVGENHGLCRDHAICKCACNEVLQPVGDCPCCDWVNIYRTSQDGSRELAVRGSRRMTNPTLFTIDPEDVEQVERFRTILHGGATGDRVWLCGYTERLQAALRIAASEQVARPADPVCNERGIPESECPAHCHHDPRTRPAQTGPNDA